MLTEPGDLVVDPFAGSCVTGEVCERIGRRWVCIELLEDYCEAALGRFVRNSAEHTGAAPGSRAPSNYYRVPRPGILWNDRDADPLPADGGRQRRTGTTDGRSKPARPGRARSLLELAGLESAGPRQSK